MHFRSRLSRVLGAPALLACAALAVLAIAPASAQTRQDPSWGAIASMQKWYGYSFNQATREAAEIAARAQCDRAAGRSRTCVVRAYFDRSCGALAIGNFGEWGSAIAPTAAAAGKEAAGRCDSHLPTEPCKLAVSVCSPR